MNKFYHLELITIQDEESINKEINEALEEIKLQNKKTRIFNVVKHMKQFFNGIVYDLMFIGDYRYSGFLNFLNTCRETYIEQDNFDRIENIFKDIKFIYNYKRIFNFFKKINQSITAKFMHPILITQFYETGIDNLQIYDDFKIEFNEDHE